MGYPEGGAMSFEYTAKAWDVHIPKVDGAARGYVKLVYMALVDYASAKNDFKAWPSMIFVTRLKILFSLRTTRKAQKFKKEW